MFGKQEELRRILEGGTVICMKKKQREVLWGIGGIAVVVVAIVLLSQVSARLVGAREPLIAPDPKGACYVTGPPPICIAGRTLKDCLASDLAAPPSWAYWAGPGTVCKPAAAGLVHSFSKVTVTLGDCTGETGGDEAKIKENLRKACFKQFITEKDKDSACAKGQELIPDKDLPPKITEDYVVINKPGGKCEVACATVGKCVVTAIAESSLPTYSSSPIVSASPSPTFSPVSTLSPTPTASVPPSTGF